VFRPTGPRMPADDEPERPIVGSAFARLIVRWWAAPCAGSTLNLARAGVTIRPVDDHDGGIPESQNIPPAEPWIGDVRHRSSCADVDRSSLWDLNAIGCGGARHRRGIGGKYGAHRSPCAGAAATPAWFAGIRRASSLNSGGAHQQVAFPSCHKIRGAGANRGKATVCG